MEREPLLPTTSRWKPHHLSAAAAAAAPPPVLCSLPENDEISIPSPSPSGPSPSSASLKDRLIFGPPNQQVYETLTLIGSPPRSPPSEDEEDPPWNSKSNFHRCSTAPAMATIGKLHRHPPSPPRRSPVVRQAVLLLSVYLSLGVLIYTLNRRHFAASETHPVVDALYFCIVTMCTIGYGDITPSTAPAKIFSITFVLVGFGFIDILLSSMVAYVLDLQEALLLAAQHGRRHHKHNYLIDIKKGRMRIRIKVTLALASVVLCIGIGTAVLFFVEKLGALDSFYLSVMSVTTVGYGDQAFKTLPGRLFASVWLLVSTLAVARAFLYLAESRIDSRHRKMAKWILSRDMTVSEFLAADTNHNGFISKSEFVVYKLKEMGKITEKDMLQICNQFDILDTGTNGKINFCGLL